MDLSAALYLQLFLASQNNINIEHKKLEHQKQDYEIVRNSILKNSFKPEVRFHRLDFDHRQRKGSK